MELRGQSPERGVTCWLRPAAWFDLTADGSATVLETNLTLNRRILNRMSCGVGGRRGQPRLLPDFGIAKFPLAELLKRRIVSVAEVQVQSCLKTKKSKFHEN